MGAGGGGEAAAGCGLGPLDRFGPSDVLQPFDDAGKKTTTQKLRI